VGFGQWQRVEAHLILADKAQWEPPFSKNLDDET